jgi:hypothetical protein
MTILHFPGAEIPDPDTAPDGKSSIQSCLDLATQRDLAEVFIIGRKNDGDVWFSTNEGDIGNMLFLLETAKAIILKEALGG